ncbi:hypothetical protein QOT17_021190 [Balamuthia mandrillaris]
MEFELCALSELNHYYCNGYQEQEQITQIDWAKMCLFPAHNKLISFRLFPYQPYHTWQHWLTFSCLDEVRLMQNLLTAEMLLTFQGKPNEDSNIFLTLFDCCKIRMGMMVETK